MKIKYDRETDVIYIRFSNNAVTESSEEKPGIILDYDEEGKLPELKYLTLRPIWDR